MRVLDACAAPGGKTAHLLETAAVELLAIDKDEHRLRDIDRLLARLGLEAALRTADAAAIDAWWDGRAFDRVLLDAPCSASGIVRRHPDAKWLRRPVLAPGGTLLYATCSVFAEENRDTVRAFLERHPDARHSEPVQFAGSGGQLLPDQEHDGFYYAPLRKTDR
jgi:16S rRNA (cytosine967-C5)-methyltransferase